MTLTLNANTGNPLQVVGHRTTDFDFALTSIPRDGLVSGAIDEQVAIDDYTVDRHTSALVDREADVIVEHLAGDFFNDPISLSSLNEAIGTVDADGEVTRVADGIVGILARTRKLTRRINVTLLREGGQVVDTFREWSPGSLARHCWDAVKTRMAAANPSNGLDIYSVKDHAAGTYTRNPNLWCADLDLTCVSPYNTQLGDRKQCTAITPRHYIFSNHYGVYPTGTTVRFVTDDGVVVERTTAQSQQAGTDDLRVGILDSALPGSITPIKVLPADADDYAPTILSPTQYDKVIAGIRINQTDQARAGEAVRSAFASDENTTDTDILAFYGGDLVSGDSGSPGFWIINNEAVLVTTWTFGGGGGGPAVYQHLDEINAAIAAVDTAAGVSTGYTVTTVDLSGFHYYG